MANRSLSDYSLLILKGIAMGIANKIPGVSGGIVAVVTGFYEELIFSFQRLNFKAISLLFRGRFRTFWQYINGTFLIALFVGVILSYFTLSLMLDVALNSYPLNVWALFFGLVLASAIILYRDFSNWRKRNLLLGFVGLTVGIGLSVLSPSEENTNLLYIFFVWLFEYHRHDFARLIGFVFTHSYGQLFSTPCRQCKCPRQIYHKSV